jgi:hypothetical protein
MGRYSRKDMIEFAKFAKSWQTPRGVEKAYEKYLKGKRLTRRGVRPLTEGKTKTNVKHYPNGIPPKMGPPPSPRVVKRNE